MSKLFGKGKVLITYVSVLAILAVSVLSVFSGGFLGVFAEDDSTDAETTVTYPLNGKYDADYTEVTKAGIWYETVDLSKKTRIDKFTGYDMNFCVNDDTEGNGTANNPYIIKTANQFAAVVTCNLKDEKGNWLDTDGLYFMIADDVYGFDLNNTGSTVDFSKDNLTAADVEKELKDAAIVLKDAADKEIKWANNSGKVFKGRFDGNGACVFGLKADAGYSAIFPKIGGNITVKNLTIKNCYFKGTDVAAFFGNNNNSGGSKNTKHFMLNCQAYNNVLVCTYSANETIQKCGIFVAQTTGGTESNLVVTDCLVYGNIAKHAQNDDDDANNRNITYGLVGNLHRDKSLMITNSIIMDSAPHALYYGSNAHLTSSYKNLYTNAIGFEWENYDIKVEQGVSKTIKYVYKYTLDPTKAVHVEFDHYEKLEDGSWKNLTNNGGGYDKILTGTNAIIKTPDEMKAATSLEGIDPERWTYNKNGYPTPKVYKIREYSAGTNWSGEQAVQFGEGDGSEGAPYTIATAEELALMLTQPKSGAYYKLVADIAINDTTAENWTENAKTWFTSNDVPVFEASLDGDGHTVSGIYYDGKQAGDNVGLIPVVGNTAEIREITIANSVIKADKGSAGAIAGSIADRLGKVVKFNADTVEDTVIFDGKATFGGMIGTIGYSALHMNDCISKTHGLFNKITGEAKVYRCVSIGAYPFADNAGIITKGVYTDTAGAELEGLYVISNEEMLGSAASKNMAELNFPTSWETTTDSYPAPTGAAASAEGQVGEVWSGAVATGYAGGSGTEEDPYLIETPEQLAKLVSTSYRPKLSDADKATMTPEEITAWNLTQVKYYKLTADIYVNDVNGKLWKDKVGCLDWYSQWVNGSYVTNSHINLDGDGHVIYGLYYNHPLGSTPYVRVGLFPVLCQYSTIENVGLSNVHFVGVNVPNTDPNHVTDTMGAFVGCSEDYDSSYGFDSHDGPGNKEKSDTPRFQALALKIKNCFVDHDSYISAYFTGGFIGSPFGAPILENCLFTGSIGGHEDPYYTGALTGCDSTYATWLKGCVVFPTTDKVNIVGGSNGASWRTGDDSKVVYAEPVYFFNLKQQYGGDYIKITKPQDRFGDAAREAMPLLDWADDYSDYSGWSVVEDSVPLPSIFKKGRTEEEFKALSTNKFNTPKVTVSFVTEDPEIVVPDMQGEMYAKDGFVLPELERPGYEFTGWYVFSDWSIEYPYDYFPPRDLILYAGWEPMGITQNFENYPDSIWDYDEEYWILNKPGARGGYKNKYVRNGSKSLHLLGNKPEAADALLNYEDMLIPGKTYTVSFWVTTDKADNPATLLSLVHNNYPDYLDTAVAMENMAVVAGIKEGEWVQYSYTFTAQTQWISLRATGNSSLYFDDMVFALLDGDMADGNVINLGNGTSPNTADGISISVLICALMACAAVAVISKKNLVEIIEE